MALVHGDGQYAPEALPVLLEPIINEKADLIPILIEIKSGLVDGKKAMVYPLFNKNRNLGLISKPNFISNKQRIIW